MPERHWQLLMTGLVEAIVADAIEASALDFPEEHAFWGAFTRVQSRDIVARPVVARLSVRWARRLDGRAPAIAAGPVAGARLCRARPDAHPRSGPTATSHAALFADVTVAADEWLAGVAGDLTLAEMVAMLGRRADGLAEVWNHWGRIRPLLLDEA